MKRNTPKSLPSQGELRRLFDYDTETGHLIWRKRPLSDFPSLRACGVWNARYGGNVAGCIMDNRYFITRINNKRFLTHRLVWCYHYGSIPYGMQIDHIDGMGLNNLVSNLRVVTNADNNRNRGHATNNTSGIKGVSFCRLTKKWKAQVQISGKQHWLGRFKNVESAATAVAKFYRENGFSERHIAGNDH